jgi:two-component system, NarL family, sensor kinase
MRTPRKSPLGLTPVCFAWLFLVSIQMLPQYAMTQKKNEDSLKTVIQTAKNDTARLDALQELGAYYINHKRQDSAGLELLKQAETLAQQMKYPLGMCQILLTRGSYYRKRSDWANAIASNQRILEIAPAITDTAYNKRSRMMAYNNLAGIYNINGDFATSLENRLKARDILETMKRNYTNLFIVYTNIASDYRQLAQFKKAEEYLAYAYACVDSAKPFLKLEYWYEKQALAEMMNDSVMMARSIDSMERNMKTIELSDYQKLDYGLTLKKLRGNYQLHYEKNHTAALASFNSMLQLAEELMNKENIVSAQYNIGRTYYLMGRYDQAIPLLEKTYRDAIANDFSKNAYRSANLLAELFEKRNNPAKGLQYLTLAYRLNDSLVSAEKVGQLNFLEARYQNEKKEKEISNLQKTNQEKEFVIRKKNLFITGTVVLLALLAVLSFIIYRYFKNKQQLARKEKDLQTERINSLEKQQQVISLQSMINGQETERTRVAKDLHDGLGGVFSTVKMHFSTLQHEVPDLKTNALYKKSYDLVNSASEELRKVAQNLMPEVLLKIGLVEALQDFCNNINAGKLLHISLQAYGMNKRLGASTEITVYRIIQELINNIIKHAHATEAIIQFNKTGNRLTITVEDNGQGFDMQEIEQKRSMGIQTIKSRVDYLNGKLSIDSRKDVGTTVMIDLLINE